MWSKRIIKTQPLALFLVVLLLAGCGQTAESAPQEVPVESEAEEDIDVAQQVSAETGEISETVTITAAADGKRGGEQVDAAAQRKRREIVGWRG